MWKLTSIAVASGLASFSTEVTVSVQSLPQAPPEHSWPDGQAIAPPHWPPAVHVSSALPEHCVAPGVQTAPPLLELVVELDALLLELELLLLELDPLVLTLDPLLDPEVLPEVEEDDD